MALCLALYFTCTNKAASYISLTKACPRPVPPGSVYSVPMSHRTAYSEAAAGSRPGTAPRGAHLDTATSRQAMQPPPPPPGAAPDRRAPPPSTAPAQQPPYRSPTAAALRQHELYMVRDDAGTRDDMSVDGTASLAARSANLAESVYDGVRSRIKRLQEDVRQRDTTIVSLHKVWPGSTDCRCVFAYRWAHLCSP